MQSRQPGLSQKSEISLKAQERRHRRLKNWVFSQSLGLTFEKKKEGGSGLLRRKRSSTLNQFGECDSEKKVIR